MQYANSGLAGNNGVSTITINTNIAVAGTLTQNFKSLCYGDVDASYSLAKAMEDGTTADVTVGDGLSLSNFPNPFNDMTTIQFTTPTACKATVDIYNMFGEKIATLNDPDNYEGVHTINYKADGLASGIYFYRVTLKTGNDIITQVGKMVVNK